MINLRKMVIPSIVIALNAIHTLGAGAAGTWTKIVNGPPAGFSNCMLLTDGTVMFADGGNRWFKLTPDIHGSYRNGTWSQLASMVDTRLYYSSQVLPSGNVYVAGGEYGTGGSDARGEIYNPLTNSWFFTANIPFTLTDASSILLPNGNILQSNAQSTTAQYNPSTNVWSNTLNGPDTNETDWTKLADNSILSINSYGQNTARYIPSTGQWVADASTPVNLFGYGGELGSGHLLPNGKVFWIGASPNTAIYTPTGNTNPGSWVAGPAIPNNYGAVDAPAAMMANGIVLCALGDSTGFGSKTFFYEYNYQTNAFSQVPDPNSTADWSDNTAPYTTSMMDLPDGTVMYIGTGIYFYTPSGSPLASGKPVINSVTPNSNGSWHLTGTGLNGISEGAKYGDDKQMTTNYPIVRLTNNANGNVYYARTYNWSSTSIMTGSAVLSTDFSLPAGLPMATYSVVEVANGIASNPVNVVLPQNGGALPNGRYEIVATTTGNCLDCYGGSGANGTAIQCYPYMGQTNQLWDIANLGNGYYSIRSANGGRSLDCTNCSPDNGTYVELWDYWGGACQQWAINSTGNGVYRVLTAGTKADGSHDVLDGENCSGATNTRILLWSWGGGGCQQQWNFVLR